MYSVDLSSSQPVLPSSYTSSNLRSSHLRSDSTPAALQFTAAAASADQLAAPATFSRLLRCASAPACHRAVCGCVQMHTAVKIAPCYQGAVVYVLDASRSVPVAQTLLDERRKDDFMDDIREQYGEMRDEFMAGLEDRRYLTLADAQRKGQQVWMTASSVSVCSRAAGLHGGRILMVSSPSPVPTDCRTEHA